ncbi:cysteine desulfurase family protein [uncultured Tyzzerella sp.]|uniref:cysteine desulfurase family protein n=1 Tax=uncultured Tyzzerella sp. TaxID=2321398 RepID=UPI002943C617|nr:cysteine desulfurase family protein [uncultured Tyzzerella sp.]
MIYFDNSATTKIGDEVLKAVLDTMENNFANASSLHRLGYETEQKIISAKKGIANIIGGKEDEIYFTSGGTEANNIAIFGVCDAYKKYGNKIITTKIEHPSVLKCFNELENRGFEVCYLDVDNKGYINIDNLINEIDDNTIFVSIMYVNNEIGTIQNIDEIGKKIKEKNKNTIFHTDAVQAFGKLKINVKYIDLMSVSGHKIHSQKGIGFLYVKNGVRLNNIIFGAGQQKGLRSGTINSEGIIGLYKASEIAYKNLNENFEKTSKIRKEIISLKDKIKDMCINGDEENGIPYILSLSFKDVKGEVLLHSLEDKGIFVSTGSACSSKNKKDLSTIYYVNENNLGSTIRVSFSFDNTLEEAKIFNNTILDIIPMLRIYTKR